MKRYFKKLSAVVMTLGLIATSFANGITAKAEEAVLKKGTVITDFKEIKDVKELVPGTTYFFSLEEYVAKDAVASLPEGSAILQFAGTDAQAAVDAGTFYYEPEYYETYATYREEQFRMLESSKGSFIPLTKESTIEEVCAYIAKYEGLSTVPTSWDEVLQALPRYSQFSTVEAYKTYMYEAYLEEYESILASYQYMYPEDEAQYLERNYYASWDEARNELLDEIKSDISHLPNSFSNSSVQAEQDGFVTVIQMGEGFDHCPYGTIAYLTEETDTMKQQLEMYEYFPTKFDGAGWYYGCYGGNGGAGYVGPFYLYSYKVNEFTADDLIVTFRDGWQKPTQPTTVTKNDLTLSVVIDGEEIFIPFFELSDSNVDPENEDTTITITVDEIEKVVDLCNEVAPGDVEKEVQIEEGAPTVGLDNNVDELKETVLSDAEIKLVQNGVNIDIYLTVANKDEKELGEDKKLLETKLNKNDKAVYLDLKLFKQIGSNEPTAISKVAGGKIKISIEVPEEIKAFAANAKIMRVHGTEVDELETSYDATTNKLTFETDRFSTYAIVYAEATPDTDIKPDTDEEDKNDKVPGTDEEDKNDEAPDTDEEDKNDTDKNDTDENTDEENVAPEDTIDVVPDTGDSSMVVLCIIAAIAGAVYLLVKKLPIFNAR